MRKYLGIVAVAAISLAGGCTSPGRHLLWSASVFVDYYRALEDSKVPAGFFERVAISLTLASADANTPKTHGCSIS